MREIGRAVCAYFGVPFGLLRSERRDAFAVRKRQVFMYLARLRGHYSFPSIGRALNRDHTTVRYGVGKIELLLEKRESVADDVAAIVALLEGGALGRDPSLPDAPTESAPRIVPTAEART